MGAHSSPDLLSCVDLGMIKEWSGYLGKKKEATSLCMVGVSHPLLSALAALTSLLELLLGPGYRSSVKMGDGGRRQSSIYMHTTDRLNDNWHM